MNYENPGSIVDIIDRNPGSTVDMIVEIEDKILLVKRKYYPFKNTWALPGGFLDYGKETLEQAAVRELEEETNLKAKVENLELLGVYSAPDRDPRGHTIAHVYIVRKVEGKSKAGDDAAEAKFFSKNNLPRLAFDHDNILQDYFKNES